MHIVKMVSRCTHEEASFVFLDDLENISILFDEDNYLEEKITHIFHEVHVFFISNARLKLAKKISKS